MPPIQSAIRRRIMDKKDDDGLDNGLEGRVGQDGQVGLEGKDDGVAERGSAELKSDSRGPDFASPEPLTPKAILQDPRQRTQGRRKAALQALKQDYERPGGLQFVEVAGGFQIVTRQDLHEWVRRLFHERTSQKLTVQALETLAVIAYKQPLTALEVSEIRGVNTSGVLNTLLERHLIKIVGRKQVVGRPFMYATTKEFLIRFGLNDRDLPRVEDMSEALVRAAAARRADAERGTAAARGTNPDAPPKHRAARFTEALIRRTQKQRRGSANF